jgi:nucleotide-binding universal stress UspA family protein
MHRYRHLMVALSRTETDPPLLRYAAMVARLGTANELRFVHVIPGRAAPSPPDVHQEALRDLEASVHQHAHGIPGDTRVSCDVLHGPLTDQLLTHAADRHVDLLFVGHRRSHSGRKALARRLAMKAPCSVWMVPDGSPPAIGRILVPIDFSDHAADAMGVAASLAQRHGLREVLALHVYFDEARTTFDEYDQILRGQEQEAFRQFISPINCHGVEVKPLFEEGADTSHTIDRVAAREQADLIVMATRGRSRSAAILLGSVTEDVILQAQVPLLVVKHFGARLGVLQALLDRRFLLPGGLQTD